MVQRFNTYDEALAWQNDVHHRLAASEWVRDASRVLNPARVGYGKDLSMYLLEDYTQIKHAMAKL